MSYTYFGQYASISETIRVCVLNFEEDLNKEKAHLAYFEVDAMNAWKSFSRMYDLRKKTHREGCLKSKHLLLIPI